MSSYLHPLKPPRTDFVSLDKTNGSSVDVLFLANPKGGGWGVGAGAGGARLPLDKNVL